MHLTNLHFYKPRNYLYSRPVKSLQGYGVGYGFAFNGKERDNETYGEGNAYDFGARIYDTRIGRWMSVDPLDSKYPNISPFAFSLNSPIGAYDPDGKRVYFVSGAGNDQSGWNYNSRWSGAFNAVGIKFKTINASHGSWGDIGFTTTYRNNMKSEVKTGYRGTTVTIQAINDKQVQIAVNAIIEDISKNKLENGEQLNLAGYSYGSVLQSYVAIALIEKGYKIDNLILVGSPISDNSELMNKLNSLKEAGKIGNIKKEDIPGDKLSSPKTDAQFNEGAAESAPKFLGGKGNDAPHFDLARPGTDTDKKIVGKALKLKKEGVK